MSATILMIESRILMNASKGLPRPSPEYLGGSTMVQERVCTLVISTWHSSTADEARNRLPPHQSTGQDCHIAFSAFTVSCISPIEECPKCTHDAKRRQKVHTWERVSESHHASSESEQIVPMANDTPLGISCCHHRVVYRILTT